MFESPIIRTPSPPMDEGKLFLFANLETLKDMKVAHDSLAKKIETARGLLGMQHHSDSSSESESALLSENLFLKAENETLMTKVQQYDELVKLVTLQNDTVRYIAKNHFFSAETTGGCD